MLLITNYQRWPLPESEFFSIGDSALVAFGDINWETGDARDGTYVDLYLFIVYFITSIPLVVLRSIVESEPKPLKMSNKKKTCEGTFVHSFSFYAMIPFILYHSYRESEAECR